MMKSQGGAILGLSRAGAQRRMKVAGHQQDHDRSAGIERALFSAGVLRPTLTTSRWGNSLASP